MAAGGTNMELLLGGLAAIAIIGALVFALRWKGAATALAGREREFLVQQDELARITSIANERGGLVGKLEAEERRSNEIRAEREAARTELDAMRDALSAIEKDHARLGETLAQERRQAAERDNNRE